MKQIILLALVSLILGSCATVSRGIRYVNGPAARNGDQVARKRVAATNIKSYRDQNTNAVVYKSMYEDYCFSVSFGTIKLQNTSGAYIEVYGVNKETKDWILRETVHRNGPFVDIVTQTNGQRQIISFASGDNGALFARVYTAVWNPQAGCWKKARFLRSYTF